MAVRTSAFFLVALLIVSPFSSIAQESVIPKLAVIEYRLKNGLRVVLHRDTTNPTVAVNVTYDVGSKNETKGRTGLAHLFEHLMFQGSKTYDTDYAGPIEKIGGGSNGSTSTDMTEYYEIVPSNYLEHALAMESDRMGGLLDAVSQAKLDTQRDVVKNERRVRIDNQPYGDAYERISEIMYPEDHPLHWPIIGSMSDLSEASLEDAKAFFRKYYGPNNAVLVIAGDLNREQTKKWVETYFGPIPSGVAFERPKPKVVDFKGEVRKEIPDDIRLPRRYMAWLSVPLANEDSIPMRVLSSVLIGGRGSRLRTSLIYQKKIAQDVGGSGGSSELGGQFVIHVTASKKEELDAIEKEVYAEIEKIKAIPPTQDEVDVAKNIFESNVMFGLDTNFVKTLYLAGATIRRGEANSFREELLKYSGVTPADLQRVARKYLNQDRVILTYVPGQKASKEVVAKEAERKAEKPQDISSLLPKPGPNPQFKLPRVEKKKFLNGLEVWLVKNPEVPVINTTLLLRSGSVNDPAGKSGLASFTAGLINKGTATRSATEISNEFQKMGITPPSLRSDHHSTTAGFSALARNYGKAISIFSDMIVGSSFPDTEFQTAKKLELSKIGQRADSAQAIAEFTFDRVVYGEAHPYGRPVNGDQTSLGSFTRSDVEGFYRSSYLPNNSLLILVGDIQPDTVANLEKAFGSWKPSHAAKVAEPKVSGLDSSNIFIVDKPGAAQSQIWIGHIGMTRDNPDYVPFTVLNTILGGGFSSRLNSNLRENKGYTYGASSNISWREWEGPFTAAASVQTSSTGAAIVEFLKELNGIRGEMPISAKDLAATKRSLIQRFPNRADALSGLSGYFQTLAMFGLDDRYFDRYLSSIEKVTLEDLNRVARKYIRPEHSAIVIVGDRQVIEPQLRTIEGVGERITHLDINGGGMNSYELNSPKLHSFALIVLGETLIL